MINLENRPLMNVLKYHIQLKKLKFDCLNNIR